MAQPFLGQVSIVGFDFAPPGWAQCDGQILPINQAQALFSVLGTTYGGDGRTSFALPDLRGRVPVQPGASWVTQVGAKGGTESHVLSINEIPSHQHEPGCTDQDAQTGTPTGAVLARATSPLYAAPNNLLPIDPSTIGNPASSGQGHPNMQPFLALNFVIAVTGEFPD